MRKRVNSLSQLERRRGACVVGKVIGQSFTDLCLKLKLLLTPYSECEQREHLSYANDDRRNLSLSLPRGNFASYPLSCCVFTTKCVESKLIFFN